MTPLTDEQLDASLAQMPFPDVDREFDDGLLHRYRHGELDEATASRVERLLLESPRARAVLAEAARPVDEHLLLRLEPIVTTRTDEGSIANRLGIVAVAIALAASVVAVVMRPVAPDFAPRLGLTSVAGQVQEVRSGDLDGLPDSTPQFVPDAQMKLVLRPLEGNAGGIPDIAIYRIGPDGRLVRVTEATLTPGPGGVRITGRAGDVLGGQPGTRRLHLVLSPPGEPPAIVGRTPDEARGGVCSSCWLTIDAELLPEGAE